MTNPKQTYGLDYYHPYFGWMRWEPGDKEYATRYDAEVAVSSEETQGSRTRIVETY